MDSSRENVLKKFRSIVRKLSNKDLRKSSYQSLIEASASDEGEGNDIAKSPRMPRRGFVAMYVGEEAKRYEIPIRYFSIPSFQELIEQEEGFDSKIEGPIRLLCSTTFFDEQLQSLQLVEQV